MQGVVIAIAITVVARICDFGHQILDSLHMHFVPRPYSDLRFIPELRFIQVSLNMYFHSVSQSNRCSSKPA